MSQAVIVYTTGQPGAGKSYSRCARYLVEFFFNSSEAPPEFFWSNFPINFDGLETVLNNRYPGKWSRQEIERRCRVFPPDVVRSWESHKVGPWDYFADNGISLSESHISIDEIHVFCPRDGKQVGLWNKWLGEIRHEGATIEFLTQSPAKVAKCIENHAGIRRNIVRCDDECDVFFGIPMFDWYQVATIFGAGYVPAVREIVLKMNIKGRWEEIKEMGRVWRFDPELFPVYDSHSASNFTGRAGNAAKLPYQRFGKVRLLSWFVFRNWWRFFSNYWAHRIYFVLALFVFVNYLPDTMRSFAEKYKRMNQSRKAAKMDEPGPLPGENPDLVLDVSSTETRKSVLVARDVDFEEIPRGGGDFQFGPMGPMFKNLPPKAAQKVAIVGIAPDRCWDANGRWFLVGDELGGSTIWVIDYENRRVRFNDGSVAPVLVFGMPATIQADSFEAETDVSNAVRSAGQTKTETSDGAGIKKR